MSKRKDATHARENFIPDGIADACHRRADFAERGCEALCGLHHLFVDHLVRFLDFPSAYKVEELRKFLTGFIVQHIQDFIRYLKRG